MDTRGTVDFTNTAVAFAHKSDRGLKKARLLFKSFDFPILLKWGPAMARAAVFLGMKGIIRNTIFEQFCGGETIEESMGTVSRLQSSGIGTILDYSVEGEEREEVFEHTCAEILQTIERARGNAAIPFSVFKTTGIIRFALLEKVSAKATLTEAERQEWDRATRRFEGICKSAHDSGVRVFVDAEESWIQPAIDALTEEMMEKYNMQRAIVFNTIQLYRHDRLEYMKHVITGAVHYLGFKLVRGAYMEKERERASALGYASPIQPDKAKCDKDYNEALLTCIHHIDRVSVCAGTHNEESSLLGTRLMAEKGLSPDDERVWFSQLLGMSDHISYNLAHAGYNVAKYVPYGPVTAVIPYLTRRAQENTSAKGQAGRELSLIETELKRRKTNS
ncbi:MAG: proline dehydrogenase family protein [Bacteroidetes bacterium]|nr:proline dehydrogenase family protein [Bacteroidota bacterium]